MADSSGRGTGGDLRLLRRYWPFASPFRRLVFVALLSIPVVSLLALGPPFLMMHGIDVNLTGRPAKPVFAGMLELVGLASALEPGEHGLGVTCLLFVGVAIAEYLGRSLQVFTLQYAGHRSVGLLRQTLFRHVSSQSAAFFDRNPTGALLTRTTNDIESLGESLTTGAITILADVFNIVAIAAFMLTLSVKLTLVSFAIAPILVVVVNFFRRRLKETFLGVRRALAEVNAFLQEHLAGVGIVQLFNREAKTYEEFKSRSIKHLRQTQRSNIYDASLYAIMEGMASLCVAGLLWYGGLNVMEGVLTLGLLVAFIEYIQKIFVPIKEFSGKFAFLQQAVAAMERVVELLDTHQEIVDGTRSLSSPTGAITFEDVRFQYTESGGEVLKGISLEVRPNEVLAIVGATGSGKTTIGKLLTRMYEGYRGSITLDGHELDELTADSVRAHIGVVQQDVTLFSGSVAFNIGLGNPAIDRARTIEAAKLVQAHEFIEALPGGYEFQVSERGANLSAGQAQLIAFARVMAHDPPIVLLDEATASVDSRTEAAIQTAIELIFRTKTVIVIAHRLSTIQAADQIVVMHQGEIVEIGTHSELLEKNGRYARLYRTGFAECSQQAR